MVLWNISALKFHLVTIKCFCLDMFPPTFFPFSQLNQSSELYSIVFQNFPQILRDCFERKKHNRRLEKNLSLLKQKCFLLVIKRCRASQRVVSIYITEMLYVISNLYHVIPRNIYSNCYSIYEYARKCHLLT